MNVNSNIMPQENIHTHTHANIRSVSNILIALVLNIIFVFIEIAGAWWTNSIAIYADAIHDFGDVVAIAFAYYFEKISQKKRDNLYSYGYKRFSLLGAFINSFVMIVGSLLILEHSITRIWHIEKVDPNGMMLLSLLGIILNGTAAWYSKSKHSLNEEAIHLHLLEDVLGWVIVLIGSIVLKYVDYLKLILI